jgi:hypothetical protein
VAFLAPQDLAWTRTFPPSLPRRIVSPRFVRHPARFLDYLTSDITKGVRLADSRLVDANTPATTMPRHPALRASVRVLASPIPLLCGNGSLRPPTRRELSGLGVQRHRMAVFGHVLFVAWEAGLVETLN